MRLADPGHMTWLLQNLCHWHRVPFDAALAARAVPGGDRFEGWLELLGRLGFKASLRRARELGRLPTPFVVFCRVPPGAEAAGGAGAGADAPVAVMPALVLRCDGGQALLVRPDTDAAQREDLVALAGTLERVLLLRRRPAPLRDADAAGADVAGAGGGIGFGVAGGRFGLRSLLPLLLRDRPLWRDVLLASLVLQLVSLATPLCTQVIIDKVLVHHSVSTLCVIGVALGLFLLFGAALAWTRQHLLILAGNRVDAVLGATVFGHLLHLPARWFEQRPTGVIAARLQAVETVREFLAGSIVTLLLDLPFLFIFVALMAWYSLPLTLVVLCILALLVVASLLFAPRFQALLNRQFLAGARNQGFMTEYVAGMETVKSLQMEPLLRARYRDLLGDYLGAARRTKNLGNTYHTLAGSLEQLMTLAVLLLGAWLVMTGSAMTIGMLVAFQMLAARVAQPLLRLSALWQQYQQARIAVERLGDILDVPVEPQALAPARGTPVRGELAFEQLGFRHAEDRPFLYRGLDLQVPAGRVFAVVGPSGCGKSTLARLLLGFYAPVEGVIRLDGTDIRHLAANELRAAFGMVPQETTLFAGTVADNLRLASPQATFEDLVHACRLAGIHAAIEQLPQGYQTAIGERGAGLSGGQRQRLAIARALLRRPRVLILDEATAHLDDATAAQVCATLNQLRGQVTMLFITHRLPANLQVDGVIRLGRSVLAGAPAEATAGLAPVAG